ncbi:hypothetical protein CPLU01_13759 [Colletotrichum plurivorum]|uniref:NAD(P)-binding domain-containing protein n=1 Tax=Colletotrichum plurivorum TaxID=2175906 RepID=A0A8H6JP71_9PEZI|nr:hypothetical protein CPLU01_13759 [Colletotrichum plurivorum]
MPVKAAFIGATGATLSHVLAKTLLAGLNAAALVRDSAKLKKLLLSRGVPKETIESSLVIVEGTSSRSVAACIELLRHDPEIIFSGITSLPKYQLNPFKPVSMQDETITGDSAIAVIEALRQLQSQGALSRKPIFASISSVGHGAQRDQPLLMVPLYWWLLRVAQADMAIMEKSVREAAIEESSPLGGYVMLRPPLLTDGAEQGIGRVRVGWTVEDPGLTGTQDNGPGVTVGYTISRMDLANWMFKELVEGEVASWDGKCVTLTY